MKESQIHQAFSKWLNVRGVPYVHSNTHRRSSTTVGDPDYVIGWMGKILFLEIKVPGNKLSPAQEQRIAFIRAAGCRCEVCYSLEACVAAAEELAPLIPESAPRIGDGADQQRRIAGVRTPTENSGTGDENTPRSGGVTAGETAPPPNSRIAKILGQDWVIAPDQDGVWDRIRKASAADLVNFERVK